MIKKKNGIALPISLFILTGLLLSSVILIRSSEFSTHISGDLGFKNKTSNMNDWVVSQAFNWLVNNKNSLDYDSEELGYFSSAPATYPDYTKDEVWVNARNIGKDFIGNDSSYIIYRMCSQSNKPYNSNEGGITNQCAVKKIDEELENTSSMGFNSSKFTGHPQVYFKIIVRTLGPKNTKSISETVVSIAQ